MRTLDRPRGAEGKNGSVFVTGKSPFLVVVRCLALLLGGLLLLQCGNSPYRPGEAAEGTLFSSFSSSPTKMDPATSYYSHEADIIDPIYEFPFTYHYLKRPYELIPRTAEEIPVPAYFDKEGNRLPPNASVTEVARAEYTIRIKKGIQYQDHPCFALDDAGRPFYRDLTEEDLKGIETPNDFARKGTR